VIARPLVVVEKALQPCGDEVTRQFRNLSFAFSTQIETGVIESSSIPGRYATVTALTLVPLLSLSLLV
jgi:hypothetical protein